MKHKHHIVPKYKGGTDNPSNLIEVSVEEHANLHLSAYLSEGRVEDWVAYHGLMKMMGKEECIRTIQSVKMKEMRKNLVFTKSYRKKLGEAAKRRGAKIYCVELAKQWDCASDAGEELAMNPKCLSDAAAGRKHGTHRYNKLTFYRV